jgi:glucose/mannose transport system permease protein
MAEPGILNLAAAGEAPLLDRSLPTGRRPRPLFSTRNVMVYGVLIVTAAYYLVPLYVMLVTSLKTMPEIRQGNIFALPAQPSLDAWWKAWATACTGLNCDGLSRGFWNSVQITVPSVILSILIASVNGYALANWRYRGVEIFFTILIVGAFIPYQVMIYPIVLLLKNTGDAAGWVVNTALVPLCALSDRLCAGPVRVQLYGTLTGLVIVHTIFGMPILTLLFRNYFVSVPDEIFKAARIDGAGFWGIFFRIMAPMSLPIFVVAIIIQVTGIWNDFLFGVVYTTPNVYPMTVQLNNIVNSVLGTREYNVNMAATILTGLVPLAIYFASGRLFVRGISAGAVRG